MANGEYGLPPTPGWDWNKMIPMWDFHEIQLNGWFGWELENGQPFYIDLTVKKGKDRSSRDTAISFDDIAQGAFYYRDWTESGLPFVDSGEVYRSRFWFALKADMETFKELFG